MTGTDEALMIACRQGDEAAFGELVARYADHLYGYLARLSGSREAAEDLFQETFMRVFGKARTFRPGLAFKPWLFGIATHAAADARRRAGCRPVTVCMDGNCHAAADALPSPLPGPDAAADQAERKAEVRRAVDSLPARQRAAVMLSYFEGLSYPEVAEALRCSVGTVKTHMSRAMLALARLLPRAKRELP